MSSWGGERATATIDVTWGLPAPGGTQAQAWGAQEAGGSAALKVGPAASAQGWPHTCHAHSPGSLPKKRRKGGRSEARREEGERGDEDRGGRNSEISACASLR